MFDTVQTSRRRERLFKLAGFALVLFSFTAGWILWDIKVFFEAPMNRSGNAITYVIEKNVSLSRIAADLSRRGLLTHPSYFVWLARWKNKDDKIQAGEYEITSTVSPREFLDMIVTGKIVQHELTLIEGWTFDQFRRALDENADLRHETKGISVDELMALLGRPEEHPEGSFLPETYRFVKDSSDVDLLRRAHRAMDETLTREWSEKAKDLPLSTPYQALILASLIEKETGLSEERPRISGVFIRRLRKGIRLQTDPSVIYGLGQSFDGNLRRRDLRSDTPFNTYVHFGLPPTPIAMPSAASIHAALHPDSGKALYFVARGDGGHQFSETLAEHLKAVQRYLLRPQPTLNHDSTR